MLNFLTRTEDHQVLTIVIAIVVIAISKSIVKFGGPQQ